MLFNLFSALKVKMINRKWLKELRKKNVVICFPFYILDKSKFMPDTNVYVGPGAWMSLFGDFHIGSGTIIGPRLKVHTANHNYESDMLPYNGDVLVKNVSIERNVWIGADVTLLPGIKIGEGAVVGADSCVTKDVPPFAVVGGNPAKILKYRDINRYKRNLSDGNIYFEKKQKGEIQIKTITVR